MRNEDRLPQFRRNAELEGLLDELNGLLAGPQAEVLAAHTRPRQPVVFVMGCARSGTTLAMQLLAASGWFGYPSNLISRFYAAPYIGARIQQMLVARKYAFGDELAAGAGDGALDFSSALGKTRGMLAPNEFWYFWRRYFPPIDVHPYSENQLQGVDQAGFRAELAALEAALERPLAMKGMIMNWNIPFLAELLDNVLFVHVKRDPFFNMQSLWLARRQFFGDDAAWYSFKPPEYEALRQRPVAEQLAGQVFHTNRAIEAGLAQVPEASRLVLDYEELCLDPAAVLARLAARLEQLGCRLPGRCQVPERFAPARSVKLPGADAAALEQAYAALAGARTEAGRAAS